MKLMIPLAFVVPFIVCLVASSAFAHLAVNPDNPHYFIETTTSKPVLLAGCSGAAPTSRKIDNDALLDKMKAYGITYGRTWHLLPWEGADAIWPWGRDEATLGAGPNGQGLFDMNTWNPEYWRRLRDSMAKSAKAGIYQEIHLFDRCGMEPAAPTRWGNNPWASDFNVNNLETPPHDQQGTPEFYEYATRPNLRRQQERYVRKMIDETIEYPNVIYEIENEHWTLDSPDFGSHYAKFVKEYIAEKYPDSPRLVSYNSLMKDLEAFYGIPWVDIVNKHYGSDSVPPAELNGYIETRWPRGKAISIDEFANGLKDPAPLRAMCWTIVTSGGNFHIEDPAESARPFDICRNIRLFIEQSGWDFVHAAPGKSLVGGVEGYCMAQPGVEYVAYLPKGGAATVRLAPGHYQAQWWSPRDEGGFAPAFEVTAKDGSATPFNTPDAQDWVLHVTVTGKSQSAD